MIFKIRCVIWKLVVFVSIFEIWDLRLYECEAPSADLSINFSPAELCEADSRCLCLSRRRTEGVLRRKGGRKKKGRNLGQVWIPQIISNLWGEWLVFEIFVYFLVTQKGKGRPAQTTKPVKHNERTTKPLYAVRCCSCVCAVAHGAGTERGRGEIFGGNQQKVERVRRSQQLVNVHGSCVRQPRPHHWNVCPISYAHFWMASQHALWRCGVVRIYFFLPLHALSDDFILFFITYDYTAGTEHGNELKSQHFQQALATFNFWDHCV